MHAKCWLFYKKKAHKSGGFEMVLQYSEQLYWQINHMSSAEDANDLLQNLSLKHGLI